MIIEYTNGPREQIDHYHFLNPDSMNKVVRGHRVEVAKASAIIGFTAFILFINEETALGFVLSAIALVQLVTRLPYRRRFERALAVDMSKIGVRSIRLELGEQGMTEHVEGVVSFVPWAKVRSIKNRGEIYFIELPANLWAIIPKNTMKPNGPTIEEVISFLAMKGVQNGTESPQRSGQ